MGETKGQPGCFFGEQGDVPSQHIYSYARQVICTMQLQSLSLSKAHAHGTQEGEQKWIPQSSQGQGGPEAKGQACQEEVR